MRRVYSMLVLSATLLMAGAALAQNPNYESGSIWRVTYYSIKPGMSDAWWKDFRENIKPIYEEAKKAGYLTEFKTWVNTGSEHPRDWDVAVAVLYPNWAALDQIDSKGAGITTKHYGSRESMMEAAKKRAEMREVVSSHLAREVMVK